MGVSSTKFRQALQRGEEDEAMNLFIRHPTLKRAVRLNRSFGPNHGNNTAVHYVCTHAMRQLLQDLLSEGANPLSKNSTGQTGFHLVCKAKGDDALRRYECLTLLLTWLNDNEGNEPVSKLTIEQVIDEVCFVLEIYEPFTEVGPYKFLIYKTARDTFYLGAIWGSSIAITFINIWSS